MMRFIVKSAGCGHERLGTLSGFRSSTATVIETPTSALLTQGGSVVFLTAEVLSKVFKSPQLLWVPLSNTIQLEAGVKAQGQGVAKFVGLPQHLTCVTSHNISSETQEGHCKHEEVPLWTRKGKKMIGASRYMEIMEIFKPDIILALADGHTSLNESTKRAIKAVNRSSLMLDTCIEKYKSSTTLKDSGLIGVIVGTCNMSKCEESLQNILKHADVLQGITLQGTTDGKDNLINAPDLSDIIEKIGGALPPHLVHILEGAWSPALVVSAVARGWDLFDGSYPVHLTKTGVALNLNFDMSKKIEQSYLLDMSSESFSSDFTSITEGCACLSCVQHTRAYLRHLLNTREMLASVLLSIHNLHTFDQLFHHIRQHIAAGTFPAFRDHIVQQCSNCSVSLERRQSDNKENVQSAKKLRS